MNEILAKMIAENKALCDKSVRREVRETVSVLASDIKLVDQAVGEAKNKGRSRIAKVGQCDQVNENLRIYPKGEWAKNIKAAKEQKIPAGTMIGAVDHQGCAEGGNLKTSPIMWRDLELSDDGSALGQFDVITDHSAGKDLQAQIDAGMAIGFSTYGYANAHECRDPEERKQYGLKPLDRDEDDREIWDGVVVIEDWELVKIDAVDNPAVRDARLQDNQNRNAVSEATGLAKPENEMKTLDDLKSKHPEIYALHLEAMKAVQDKVDELQKFKAKYDTIVQKLSDSLSCLAKEHGAAIPVKDGAEINAELEAQVKDLQAKIAEAGESAKKEIEAKQAELAAAVAERDELKKQSEQAKAQAAEAQRQADVKAKAAELLKGSRFEVAINKLVEKRVAETSFDVKAVEALVKEKTEEYKDIAAAPAGDPDFGIRGTTQTETEEDVDEDGIVNSTGPISSVEELAKAIKK